MRFYRLPLHAMRQWGIPLRDVAAMVYHLPLDSATYRTHEDHWQRTIEIDLLREIEHSIRIADWRTYAKRGSQPPEAIPLPWDPEPDGQVRGDVLTADEMDQWLGWDTLKKERGIEE